MREGPRRFGRLTGLYYGVVPPFLNLSVKPLSWNKSEKCIL